MNDAKFSDNNYSSNAIGMYYKIYEANNLKKMYERENNFKYDFCWRARLDYIFEDSITMDMLDFLKDNDKLYLIKDRYATGSHKKTNDKFWGGSNYIIDKMCDIYKDIPKYYKQGINIEGQTLTETQIKNNNFNVKMISNQDCYYKCQGRHEIKFKGITIKLHNLPFKLNFELAYLLLYDGYKVIGPYHKILNCFEHYGEGTRIIITTEPRREDFTNGYKKRFLIGKSIINKYVTLQFKNINEINLAKFILSLIKYQSTIEYFNFESEKRIKLEVNDEVTYRIPDRGYVAAKIININDQVIKFKKCSVLRDNVFSTNKVKHYKEGILPID